MQAATIKLSVTSEMRFSSCIVATGLLLSACANERVIEGSRSFSFQLSRLQQQEVVDNIDETIDNRFRIPRRTIFGRGSLTTIDAASLSASIPLHLFETNAGSLSGGAGTNSDSYGLTITQETDGSSLDGLRQIYQAVVYPNAYGDSNAFVVLNDKLSTRTPMQWPFIFWTNNDGSPSTNLPPSEAVSVGRGQVHQIWTTNPEAYGQFVLLTLGPSLAASQVSGKSGSLIVAAPAAPKSEPAPETERRRFRRTMRPQSRSKKSVRPQSEPFQRPAFERFAPSSQSRGVNRLLEQLQRPQPPQGDNSLAIPVVP